MADNEGATGTLADPGTQPPAGTTGTPAEPAEGEQQPPETLSLEEARKIRAESASLRKRLKDFEAKEQAEAEARLSEQERLQKRTAELERQLDDTVRSNQEYRVRSALVDGAVKLGFANPQLATRLVDHAAIEFDQDGGPTNVEQLLTGLAKTDPYLVRGRGSADAGAQGAASSSRVYTREQLRDPAFFEQNRTDIIAAANEGRIRG